MMTALSRIAARMLGIHRSEVSRVALAFFAKFWFYLAAAVAWAAGTAMVVVHFGIYALPWLLLGDAIAMIIGTLLFSLVVHRASLQLLVMLSSLGYAAALLAAYALLPVSVPAFVGFLLLGHSLLGGQVYVLLYLYGEHLFSPLEYQRLLPLIDSAAPIAGMVGGLAVAVGILVIRPETLLLVAAAAAVGLGMHILLADRHWRSRHLLTREEHEHRHRPGLQRLVLGLRHLRSTPFIRWFAIAMLVQWALYAMVEYQYTAYLDKAAAEGAEGGWLLALAHANIADLIGLHVPHPHSSASDYYQLKVLTKSFGMVQFAISAGMLLVQLLLGRWLIRHAGPVAAQLLLPAALLVGAVAMGASMGVDAAIGAYMLLKIASSPNKMAIAATYFGIPHDIRAHIIELAEGLARPAGVAIGTGAMLLAFAVLPGSWVLAVLPWAVLAGGVALAVLLLGLRLRYTALVKRALDAPGENPAKYEAIEVLSQRGHAGAADILAKAMMFRKQSEGVQVKLLGALAAVGDSSAVADVLPQLRSASPAVRQAACRALASFRSLGDDFYTQVFTKHRVIDELYTLLQNEGTLAVQSDAVRVFANIRHDEIATYIAKALQTTTEPHLLADLISICRAFRDPSIPHYLEVFLTHAHPQVRAEAIIALWQLKKLRLKLLMHLLALLGSQDETERYAGMYALGETGNRQEIPRLKRVLADADATMRERVGAAIALAKMHDDDGMPVLLDAVFGDDTALKALALDEIDDLPQSHWVHKRVMLEAQGRIHELEEHHHGKLLDELPREDLLRLRTLYVMLREEKELSRIDSASTPEAA